MVHPPKLLFTIFLLTAQYGLNETNRVNKNAFISQRLNKILNNNKKRRIHQNF